MILEIFTTALVVSTLGMATPLILGALSGAFSETTGVINLGIEGMMISGAFGAAAVSLLTGSPWFGLLFGVILGGVMGVLLAVMTIKFKANQSVVGVGLNIFAGGIPALFLQYYWGSPGRTPQCASIKCFNMGFLEKIPVIGTLLGELNPITYITLIIVILAHQLIFNTPFGLRMRAVGHHPKAADTVGINVFKIRYICVITSGMLAGLGGAYLSVAQLSMYSDGMVAGRGFIALAAMILGKRKPIGCLLAGLLFGFAEALQMTLQAIGVPVASDFLLMSPYIVTLLVLILFVGKTIDPGANGKPYVKG